MGPVSVNSVRKLVKWYGNAARDLPWRKTHDPYRIWLSEIMLQQTQVRTVIPYYERFIARFPTVESLADAPEAQVLALWAGLGYYSRARNLHRGAKALAERVRTGLGFPEDRDAWLEIPGVGPYTAGAVCSIALGLREPVVDGNVVRVFSRLFAHDRPDPGLKFSWALATRWVQFEVAPPGVINQALMELGAMVCKPRSPDCTRCPLHRECRGRDAPERYPAAKKRAKTVEILESVSIVLRRSRGASIEVLLKLNREGPWRKGLWDFPDGKAISFPLKSSPLVEWKAKYVVTRHRVNRHHRLFFVRRLRAHQGLQWFSLSSLPAIPAPTRKALLRAKAEIDETGQ